MLNLIHSYFPNLTPEQKHQFGLLEALYKEWNDKINVISRKDIDNLYIHHVLHSLAIAKFVSFTPETKIFDLGTGGGFPGIPLAILFPECQFTLADGTLKKIKVVNEVIEGLQLKNAEGIAKRAEEVKGKFDYVVTRAVAKIDVLIPWSRRLIHQKHKNLYPNGLIALKGDLTEELKLLPKFEYREIIPISKYFVEPYFQEKFILYVQA
ncbi:MAG: 16S rRNA (guanine(527)-N(7))-methyltransferase RsmG [Saprospiraceae bacterium]